MARRATFYITSVGWVTNMRLIGIGLFAFLLAGLTILLARSEVLGQSLHAVQVLVHGPQLQFEVPMPAGPGTAGNSATILPAGPHRPLILSGLPAYQSASFLVPQDAGAMSGYLEIDLTTQVLPRVEAVLRLTIDNTRRAEILLRPGEAGRSFRIELTAHDLSREKLTVSFALLGSGPQMACSADQGIEAVVEIETTSALHLTLQNALTTPQDRIVGWGGQIRLKWPSTDAARRDSLFTASAALTAGYPVRFMDTGTAGLTPAQARAAIADNGADIPQPIHLADFYSGASDRNSLFETRSFQRETTWRIAFDTVQTRGAHRPEALELAMILGQHPNGAVWQVTVVMDGGLVAQVTPDAQSGRLQLSLVLPRQSRTNGLAIEITARSEHQPEGLCNDGPVLVAQLLPATRLVPGDQSFDDPLADLRRAVAAAGPVTLNADQQVTPLTATLAAQLLAALHVVPSGGPKQGVTQIDVLPLGAQIDTAQYAHKGPSWLVTFDADSDMINAQPLTKPITGRTPSVALLIRLPQAKS
jgi:hypothetical protein